MHWSLAPLPERAAQRGEREARPPPPPPAPQVRPLVCNADLLLRLSKRVLGTTLTNALLRPTFYKQFVAGERRPAHASVCELLCAGAAQHGCTASGRAEGNAMQRLKRRLHVEGAGSCWKEEAASGDGDG